MAQLYGSCACERNQYTIVLPSPEATSLAQVFFDNSAVNRRAQATPVTAWLRVPLDWYHSTTYALFPDETHTSIKRTFDSPAHNSLLPPTRRQFCGYCGTHLTAWNEASTPSMPAVSSTATRTGMGDFLDVTLGSLVNESLAMLERLGIVPHAMEDEEEEEEEYGADYDMQRGEGNEGMVKGGTIDDLDHVATNETEMGGVDGPVSQPAAATTSSVQRIAAPIRMQNRGIPFFEEMVENSRLGRIKRQKGGHTSRDGRTTVRWEVVEIDGSEGPEEMGDAGGGEARTKRQKTG